MSKNLGSIATFIMVITRVIIQTDCFNLRIKNSCKTFPDYNFMLFNKNCYYNPDVFATVPQILSRHVGHYENHTVTTEDGYILTIFRIPQVNPKGVVMLQHPVTGDSVTFTSQNEQSLAFLMHKQGYDVWLPNHRGTPFSEKHVNLTSRDFKYWNFSFHEIGLYDYPAIISYIKEKTNRTDIIFFGHSMSTTAATIYASIMPEHAYNHIKIFILAAPSTYLKHVKGFVLFLIKMEPMIRTIFNFLRIGNLFQENLLKYQINKLVTYFPFKKIFVYIFCLMAGWTPDEFDPELINLVLSLFPRELSMKILYHYVQIYKADGIFRQYDYGKEKNMELYNSPMPPEYPIENINVPVYLMPSSSDFLSTTEDANILYDKLSDKCKIYGKLEVSGINHVDFLFGKSRMTKVNNPIFELLDRIL